MLEEYLDAASNWETTGSIGGISHVKSSGSLMQKSTEMVTKNGADADRARILAAANAANKAGSGAVSHMRSARRAPEAGPL